jgi:hypothetical protein
MAISENGPTAAPVAPETSALGPPLKNLRFASPVATMTMADESSMYANSTVDTMSLFQVAYSEGASMPLVILTNCV